MNEVDSAHSLYVEAAPGEDEDDRARLDGLRPNTEYQVFSAKRELMSFLILSFLKVWMEAYLKNGKIKKSNVLDVTTKTGEENGEGETQEFTNIN